MNLTSLHCCFVFPHSAMRDEAHSEYQLSFSLMTAANPTQKMCSKPEPVDGVQRICSLQGHARTSKTHHLMVKTL